MNWKKTTQGNSHRDSRIVLNVMGFFSQPQLLHQYIVESLKSST